MSNRYHLITTGIDATYIHDEDGIPVVRFLKENSSITLSQMRFIVDLLNSNVLEKPAASQPPQSGNVIYKYPLVLQDSQTIEIFDGAQIISVMMQNGAPCIWALVDAELSVELREIVIIGTGNPIPKGNLTHLGSVMDGAFVWHIFERSTT